MLGWVHQPAGTQAGSPGRAVGGPGKLGYRVNVKYNRTAESQALGKGGAQGVGQTGTGLGQGSPGGVCGPGLAKSQGAGWGAVQSVQKSCESLALY